MKIPNSQFPWTRSGLPEGLLSNTKGFTLIELMLAIFILSVGILAVLVMFPLGVQTIKLSEMVTSAIQLGQEKIEEISSKQYEEISIGTATESSLPSPFSAYKREYKVSYVDPALNLQEIVTDKGIKKIEITVFWKSPLGINEKSVKITTLIAKK